MHILEISTLLCAEMRSFIYITVLQNSTVYIFVFCHLKAAACTLAQMLKRRPQADRAYCTYCAIAYGMMPVCYMCEPFLDLL